MAKLPVGMVRKWNSYYTRIRTREGGKRVERDVPLGKDYGLALVKHRRLRRQREEWKGQPTVRVFAERWITEYVTPMRSQKGPALARQRLRDFILPALGELLLAEVTEAHAMTLRASIERPRERALRSGALIVAEPSVTTVRHVMSDARCLFGFAVKARLIDRNPITGSSFPVAQEEIPNPLSDVELQRVLEACPEAHRTLVGLALWTGLRYSELRGLEWQHVQLEGDGHVQVVRTGHAQVTKSRRTRRVPLLPEAMRILREAPRGSRYVFTGRMGEMIGATPGPFNLVVAEAVPGYTFHRLRHTMASRFLRAGGMMATLQRILGHASIRTTERYAKLLPDEVDAQARALPRDWMPGIVRGEAGGKTGGRSS